MTQAVEIGPLRGRWQENGLILGVSGAHFVSHYYMLVLPPLFAFVREDYGVSYTELGLALSAFNVVSALLQLPVGFLVDRVGARLTLIGGLLLGGAALAVAGLVDSFVMLVAMFAVLGLANTVYHPADFALLSNNIPDNRIGQAYSYHSFAGMLGSMAAPSSVLFLQGVIGWRGAFITAGILGIVAAAVLAMQRETHRGISQRTAAKEKPPAQGGRSLLLSGPILINFVLFVSIAIIYGGLSNYLVVAVSDLRGTSFVVANLALTVLLMMTALGVLVGGWLLGRTTNHTMVAYGGLAITGLVCAVIGLVPVGDIGLVLLVTISGLANGAMTPSRDMIVRDATPPGAFGKVFGFVTTGFNIGGMVSPLMFGALLDHGRPAGVFLVIAAFCAISIGTVVFGTRIRPAA